MEQAVINLADAQVTLAGRRALDGIHWRLQPEEHWAVLGANGAGKSTFLRLARGELWPDQRLDAPPQVVWNLDSEPQTTPIGIRERMPLISAEFQDRYLHRNWRVNVEETVLSGFQDAAFPYRPPTDEEKTRAEKILSHFALLSLRHRSFLELSTGQARKTLFARALAAQPKILLLDEVFEGLDTVSRREMLGAVDIAAGLGAQIILATHRLDERPQCLNKALWIVSGRLVWQGPIGEAPVAAPKTPDINIHDPRRLQTLWNSAQKTGGNGPLVRLEHIDVFLERRRVLQDITWTVESGQHWALAGHNGAGKTTLLRLLAGDLPAALGGTIQRLGMDEPVSVEKLRQGMGWVSAELQANMGPGLGYNMPARLFVATGFHGSIGLHKELSPEQERTAESWLNFAGLSSLAERPIHELSYGQTRRLILARAMIHSPRLLLLDEPCSGLDAPSRRAFLEMLTAAARLTTMVYATHHNEEIIPEIRNVLVLSHGKIEYEGPREGWTA